MTITASGLCTDVVLLYKLKHFQAFFDQMYDIYVHATIQNPAVYLLDTRVGIFLPCILIV